jgi:serine/threonine protein kinase
MNVHHSALPIGSFLESYEITAVLGSGGFGITYKGYDKSLACDVAIKEYLPHGLALRTTDGISVIPKSENDKKYYDYGLQRFLDEARMLAKFKERSIVRISRFLEANGTAYLVMDYEDGESLADHLGQSGVLTEAEIRKLLTPVLTGLRVVHAKGILHRDIKPGNIFLRQDGPPVLLDFGAARQALGEHTRTLTGVVTPGYAPFEQYGSLGRQGPWTDLYALGATLYHCAVGKAPVESPDRVAALQDGSPDPLRPASEAAAGRCSLELLAMIDWMLAPNAKDRPPSADVLFERLRLAPTTTAAPKTTQASFPTTQVMPPSAVEEPSAPPSTRDQITAFKVCREEAERGDAAALYRLGMMYAYGRGTAKDEAAAVTWLRQAAEKGHVAGQCKLGLMVARGMGVTKDEAIAVDWLRKAADQGDIAAQFNVGMMYAHGLGVAQDVSQAMHWYRIAAERGHPGAQTNLEVLENRPLQWRRLLVGAAALLAALIVLLLIARR